MTKRKSHSPEIVKFNVGGTRFEVSRDILETNYPDTMLAKICSAKWQEDPEDEVFIERDRSIFGFVLSYLRDSKVHLPTTISKEMLINELTYFGVDFVESSIHEKAASKAKCLDTIQCGIEELREKARTLEVESISAEAAADVIIAFFSEMRASVTSSFMAIDHSEKMKELINRLGAKDALCAVNLQLLEYGLDLVWCKWRKKIEIRNVYDCKLGEVIVRDAGVLEINGVYNYFDLRRGVGRYVKEGIWKGQKRVFFLYRHKNHQWYISIIAEGSAPGSHLDIDFYSAHATDSEREKPPIEEWKCSEDGINPPPTCVWKLLSEENKC